MYINWAHHYIPKISGFCSIIVNFIFIYILQDDKQNKLGGYRHLLLFFAFYNLTCTVLDVLVPLAVHDHHYAFSAFTGHGLFEKNSELGAVMLSFRCSLVPATYAILHAHFVYRYLAVFAHKFLIKYFIPYGLLLTLLHCLVLMAGWFFACYYYLAVDPERSIYLEKSFRETFNVSVFDLNVIGALYREASSETISKSWSGILILSFISVNSVIILFILSALIIKNLRKMEFQMSKTTQKMQKQLMKALTVQAVILLFVSFTPCLVTLYQPVFNINLGSWISYSSCIAISFFPVLDPLALFYFIPTFRRRIKEAVTGKPEKMIAYIMSSRVNQSSSDVESHVQ